MASGVEQRTCLLPLFLFLSPAVAAAVTAAVVAVATVAAAADLGHLGACGAAWLLPPRRSLGARGGGGRRAEYP